MDLVELFGNFSFRTTLLKNSIFSGIFLKKCKTCSDGITMELLDKMRKDRGLCYALTAQKAFIVYIAGFARPPYGGKYKRRLNGKRK
jgi:hypothetical protein